MRRWASIAAALMAFVSAGAHGADFNNDGMADVLWRLPDGKPLIWQMSGLAIRAQLTVPTALNASAAIAGAGKFFGGNNADAIAWINSSDQLTLWRIANDGSLQQSCTVASGIDPNLNFLGIGDVDGDGTDDIVWRNANDDSVVAFLMDGCNAPQTLTLGVAADPAWKFAGIGDVDGDGSSDLLWQDDGSNSLIEWLIGAGGAVAQQTLDETGQSGWQVAAVADFNGDGNADVLWRDPASQNLVLWSSNGTGFDFAPIEPASPNTFAAADDIFDNGFDTGARPAPALSADWTILGAADFNGDGDADILLADNSGDTAIWLMQGATVHATGLFSPTSPDMPLPGITGWRLPLDRPTITKQDGEVTVNWKVLPGSLTYTAYGSATNNPASTGTVVSSDPPPLSFTRSDPGFASTDRYFAVSAAYHGMALPPSKEAYILEFAPTVLPYWGAMAVTDLNGDGCMDILGALGDCHGGFTLESESSVGLGALRANGRVYRDVRFADFNGDGIPDAIANTYSCDAPGCGGNDTNSQILLFFGNGDSTFTEDTVFTAMNVPGGGFGETIVVADFDNDGCLDVFLPKYTFYDPSEHDFLLINDCQGHFTDVADAAGVAQHGEYEYLRTEGAQALDINSDGWIDLYAGSQLFINNGDLTFTNVGISDDLNGETAASPWGLPAQFDEGAKFIDLDNSGQLTLAVNGAFAYANASCAPATVAQGIRLFTFDGLSHFTERFGMPQCLAMNESFGLNAADVDGDGRADVFIAGGCDPSYTYGVGDCNVWGNSHALPQLLIDRTAQFLSADFYDDYLQSTSRGWNDLQTFAHFDSGGTVDLVSRFADTRVADGGYLTVLMNQASSSDIVTVNVLGANGEQNQQGRIVRVTPDARPSVTMTQVVDSGSGYMSNGPYDLTFATPYFGAYTVSVRFADATYTTTVRSGDHVTMYADGRYAIQPSR